MISVNFSRPGRIALFLCIALFLTGITSGANLLLFLSMLIASTLFVSLGGSLLILMAQRISVLVPDQVVRNEPFILTLDCRNPWSCLLPATLAQLQFRNNLPSERETLPPILPGQTVQKHISHTLEVRGRVSEMRIRCITGWPFYFLECSRTHRKHVALRMYPRPEKVTLYPGACNFRGSLQPTDFISTHTKGHGGLFYGIREYQSGDIPRWIHWPLTARHGTLMIKEYEDSGQVFLTTLVVDPAGIDPRKNAIDFERIVDTAAGLLKTLTQMKRPVSLCSASGGAMPYREGMDARTNFLSGMDFLLDLESQGPRLPVAVPQIPGVLQNDLWILISSGSSTPAANTAGLFPVTPHHLYGLSLAPGSSAGTIRHLEGTRVLGITGESA